MNVPPPPVPEMDWPGDNTVTPWETRRSHDRSMPGGGE